MSIYKESSPGIWDEAYLGITPGRVPNTALFKAIKRNTTIPLPNLHILEVGPGECVEASFLAKQGASVSVLDFATNPLKYAQQAEQRDNISLHPVKGDGRELPYASNVFDVVISQGLMEHYEPPTALLAEQVRVAKKGGLVIVDVPQRFSVQAITKFFLMKWGIWPYGWERNYSEAELVELVSSSGLSIVDSYAYGFQPPIKIPLKSKLKQLILRHASNGHTESSMAIPPLLNWLTSGGGSSWLAKHTLNCLAIVGKK